MLPNAQENELLQQNTLLPQQQQEKKNNPWVETRARAGNFGAPVLFEDLPEQGLNEKAPDLSDFVETKTKEPEQIKSPELEENITNTQEDVPEIKSKQETEKLIEPEQQPLNTINKSLETNGVVLNTTPSTYVKASDSAKATSDTTADKPQPPVTAKIKTPTPSSSASRSSNAFSKAPAKENAIKPPITLAQLTQGFLHHRKEQSGSYGISMLGIKRGIPSEEQMRYERYLQKLVWCLQNSFNINRYKQPAISSDAPVHVFFSLDRDGILQQLSIKKSSGNMYIDQFVLFIFQDASSSFPPVPSYLTDNPFSMTCVVS